MNSSKHDNNQSIQVLNHTTYPHDQSIEHQHHLSKYRCFHRNKIYDKSQQISKIQPNSIIDNSHILLPDQYIRDLTDVYRREKDFLEQQNNYTSHKEIFINIKENPEKENDECEPKYYIKEYYYTIPCICETSLPGRIFQNFVNGIKLSIEFFLFINDVIRRRHEFIEYHYPFNRYQSYNCQVNHNYPFVHRSTYSNKMIKLNSIRNQLNKKPSPMKHTTTSTYYDIH
ncbi:unnamed protein product [Rotaria sordida]|uniref:Uncharacterized protein n=1 Tax=Rotaria sordida TaxID=392033 RepID=A0A815HC77_9BILA|nr:unnamed protein product [Rotaria sordida]